MTLKEPPRGGQGSSPGHRPWRGLIVAALLLTFLLVVLGGVVRITGSGMGCGDDWPLCNGQLIPAFEFPTLLEWGHRLVAAGVSVLVLGVAAVAWKPGRGDEWRFRRHIGAAALLLVAVQVLLGAVTVWLELPPGSVILHLGTAMLLLAVLTVGTVREYRGSSRIRSLADGASRTSALVAAGAFVVVLAGALVANLDAAAACRGFPLCSGQWWPGGGTAAQIHWGHRLLAYAFTLSVLFLPGYLGARRPGDRAVPGLAFGTVGLVLSQAAVGVAMVTGPLTLGVRALHLALGTAVFGLTVALAWIVWRPAGSEARAAPVRESRAGAAASVEN